MQQGRSAIGGGVSETRGDGHYGPVRGRPGIAAAMSPWTTGNVADDAWLRSHQVSADVMKDLGMLPVLACCRM